MFQYVKKVCFVLILFSMIGVHEVYALSMGDAINKAGRQRMLTQRMVKSYLQIGQRVKLGVAFEQREKAAELFEVQLAELKVFAKTDDEKKTTNMIYALWGPMKEIMMSEPTKDGAEELEELTEVVLSASHKLVLLLVKRAGSKAGHLVNIAGRQRMLTQRMAKFYLFQSWGMQRPEYVEGYVAAEKEFRAALIELKSSPINTAEIKTALKSVDKSWKVFSLSKLVGADQFVPAIVVRSLDKILGKMNTITAMYVKLKK